MLKKSKHILDDITVKLYVLNDVAAMHIFVQGEYVYESFNKTQLTWIKSLLPANIEYYVRKSVKQCVKYDIDFTCIPIKAKIVPTGFYVRYTVIYNAKTNKRVSRKAYENVRFNNKFIKALYG